MEKITFIVLTGIEGVKKIFQKSRIPGSKFSYAVEKENLYRIKIEIKTATDEKTFIKLVDAMDGIEKDKKLEPTIVLTRTITNENDFTDSKTFNATLNIPGVEFDRKEEAPGFFKIIVKITKPQSPALIISIGKAMGIINPSPEE